MLALEREEHAFGRLVRGLVSRLALLGEKVALAARARRWSTLLMLCGIGLFVTSTGGASPLWLVGAGGGAVAFGALGRGDRRARARGAGGVAAGLPALAADRLPRARPGRGGRHRALRRDPRRLGALPVPPGAAGGRRGAQRRAARASGRRWRTSPSSPSPTWRSRAWRCAASRDQLRMRLEDRADGDPADRPADAAAAARRCAGANREHTGPWDPARDESFYTAAGQRLELDLDQRVVGGRAAPTPSRPRHRPRRPPHRPRRAGRTSCAARGRTRRSATGSTRTRGGRGHATRAVRLVLRFAFEHAGLHRVQPAIIPRNARSVRVVEKVGLPPRGPRAALPAASTGVWEDHDIYALTRRGLAAPGPTA